MGYRFFIALLLCWFSLSSLHAGDPVKEEIAQLGVKLRAAPDDQKSEILLKLAIANYRDQNAEQAFKVFLEALSAVKTFKAAETSAEEKALYDQALKLYLEHHTGQDVTATAETLVQTVQPEVDRHPDYFLLKFLLAAAYANLGQFDLFFDNFYSAYLYYPKSYMAYRTLAILHIKLFEKSRTAEERKEQANLVFANILKAIEINPHDTSLYKLEISFAPDQQKPQVISRALKKIIDGNMMVPRADIVFYVAEAVDSQQKELAQQFVDKAREWYQYSRVVNNAQELIDQQ
jgi:tRNA-binding EMAP/Myf-like protein